MAITYLSGNRIQGLSTDTVETVTFSNDFSSSAGWTTTDASNFSVDTANSEIDFNVEGGTSAADRIYYDLGSGAVSDTSWVLRIHQLRFSSISTYLNLVLSLSSTTTSYTSSQYGIGVWFSDGGDPSDYAYVVRANGGGFSHLPNDFSGQFATNTDYYVEIIRNSATSVTVKVFTGGFSGTQLVSSTKDIASTITGLRYIKFLETQPDTPTGVRGTGTIQKVEFFNNVTSVNSKPTNVPVNSRFEETDNKKIFYYADGNWSSDPFVTRGCFGGGEIVYNTPLSNVIDYITIATTGNATDFGDLSVNRGYTAGVSSSTRGCFGGGYTIGFSNVIDYITIATTGNALDFGDLTVSRSQMSGVSSSTRGVIGGGWTGSANSNTMDYITIATTGNATDFGDLTQSRYGPAGVSSGTRGCFGGGASGHTNIIDYITIDTTGNATDFGDLTVTRSDAVGVSSSTRGCFGGGYTGSVVSNVIDYITIATTGNATDFGDLTEARNSSAGVSSSTRGCFGGGYGSSFTNVIDYITIATTGNALDFGDLTVARYLIGGVQGS